MMLCLSENGEDFDKHIVITEGPYVKRFEGMNKEGSYAYPHALVWKDHLSMIYYKGKEAIEVASVRLLDI